MNKLILGDNLEILKQIEEESVDLIYLDPPFFSNRNYEVIWGDAGEIRSFQDRWSGGIDHYIAWLKERVEQMHRILKSTGSIFLHCDWHANAYIRVLILDKIFGGNNFRNEIIWKRTTAHNNSKKLGRVYDTIFYYSKSDNHKMNQLVTDFSEKQLSRYKEDENGFYRAENLTSPGISRQFEWRDVHPGKNRSWAYPLEQLEEFFEQGLILLQKDGRPRKDGLKKYLHETTGAALQDLWTDLVLAPTNGERIGYPTQKPEKLLERFIKLASNENDVILDPFVGGGTTVAVADKLKRNWLGIDQSVQAIKVSEMRLQKQQDLLSKPFIVQLHKYDYDTLRYANAFEFESWIIQQFGGISNIKQRNDFGIDGKTNDGLPIQVKRSDNIGRNVIDNYQSACKRFDSKLFEQNKTNKKPIGVLIAFSFGRGAIEEIARLKNHDDLIIELKKVEDIVPIAKKPKLTVSFNDLGLNSKELRDIEFIATGESEAGIEFYAWDFNFDQQKGFKADILIDKIGKQTYSFKTGSYQIAIKVVDNEGLESLEVLHLKVNGIVHQK
jgi:DNA modification methylase